MMEQELNKKQNRKVTVFAIVLSIISIGLLVVGFLLVSSDKVVMLQSISNLSSKFEKTFDDSDLLDKMATSKDLGVKTTLNLTSDYANANLVFDYLENKDDKKSAFDVEFSMDNQSLLGFDGALANDSVYFYVDDITPTYYYTALEYVSVLSSLEGNDYDKILTLLKETVTDYIDNDEIKKEKVEITYNGKDKKVNKLSYAVTNKVVVEIVTNFFDSLKKDTDLLTKVAQYFGVTNDEFMTGLNNISKQLTYTEVETGLYYNVYYYGFNKIVRYELADASNKLVIEYTVADKEIINLYSDNKVAMSLEVVDNKNQYDFSGFIKDTEEGVEIPFTGNLKDDTLTIILEQDSAYVKLAITSTEEIKENNYIYKNKIVLSGISEGTEVTVGTLDINLEYYFNEKVDTDLSNSVEVNQITETDLTTIQNNLMNHPLYQLIMGMSGDIGLGL